MGNENNFSGREHEMAHLWVPVVVAVKAQWCIQLIAWRLLCHPSFPLTQRNRVPFEIPINEEDSVVSWQLIAAVN